MSAPWELEFEALMTRLLDGPPGAPDLAELEQLFATHPEAIDVYVRLMTLDTHARKFVKSNPLIVGEQTSAVGSGAVTSVALTQPSGSRDTAAVASSEEDAPPVRSPVLGFLGGAVDYVNHSRRLMFLLIAVALCGWFVFQIGSVLLGRWWAGNAQVADQGADQPGTLRSRQSPEHGLAGGTDRSHGNALAWLSGSVGGRWQIAANPPAIDPATGNPTGPVFWEIGTEFTAGKQVNLVAGLGEITFRSGAKVVISAPAQFSVTSPLGTDLQLGKLSARVPHDAKGFTVSTPQGSVVDLGTEFGVEVTPDRKLEVQVFVGEVKVASAPADGGDQSAGAEVRVAAGKTVHVEAGKTTVVDSTDKDRFQRDLKIASDSSDKQLAAYLDFVRQLKPVVWLRMEGKEAERTIHDDMGNAADGSLQWDGPGNPFVDGRVGKSLWLRGWQLGDHAIIADYPKAEHGKLSVSVWAYADSRPDWAVMVCNWRDDIGGQFRIGLNQNEMEKNGGSLDVGIMQADGNRIHATEGGSRKFPLHEWQHVAMTTDGTTLRLYLQGREVASVKHTGLLYPVPAKTLAIGDTTTAASHATNNRARPSYWDGKLDEIAVFDKVLTAEEIQKLAAAPPR